MYDVTTFFIKMQVNLHFHLDFLPANCYYIHAHVCIEEAVHDHHDQGYCQESRGFSRDRLARAEQPPLHP